MAPAELTDQQLTALTAARALAVAGIPVFLAEPDATNKTGYRPPRGWERTAPDPAVVDHWRPGLALCAVMGCGFDLLDFDPRNGGDPATLITLPEVYGIADTPSGGTHWFIRSLGTGSRDNVYPGIDVKGGTAAGTGRGFAFLAPTVRASVVTGELHAYRWVKVPDPTLLSPQDNSGAQLAARIHELRTSSNAVRQMNGPQWYQEFLNNREPQSMAAANRAVEQKLAEVREWKPDSGQGFRLVLLRSALTLGGYVGGGLLDGTEAWTRLEDAVAAVWGGPDEDDRRWIQQGLDDGVVMPFHVYREEPLYDESTQFVIETPLNAEEDPEGLLVHEVANDVDSMLWVLYEMGQRHLAGMFRRGGVVVFCARIGEEGYIAPPELGNENGPAVLRTVTGRVLQARIALRYIVWRWAGGKRDPHRIKVLTPMPVCETALAAIEDAPNLRPLRAVTHTPIVRRDGSILDIPGYDVATAYLYLPEVLVAPVPEHPTAEQVAAAVALVRGVVDEFAWASPHDEANFLGLLLTPLLRELAPPPYKLAAIMARQPGSGKSLLAKVLRIVHGGVFRTEMPADDAELAKSVTSILSQTTAPVVQFDNVTGVLGSSRLAGLLTSAVYSDRVLGSTNNVDMTNDRLWTITGNNLALGGDLVRRSLWVTIDPQVPNPEQRTGFKITDLAGYVREQRGAILHALLTMVRAWTLAGSPAPLRSSDDYARWIAVVRGILTTVGVPGEFDHSDSRQQDTAVGDDDWRLFLESIYRVFGGHSWTAHALLDKVHDGREAQMGAIPDTYSPAHPFTLDDLPTDLLGKLKYGAKTTTLAKSLGWWLRNREGRWAGEFTVRKAGQESEKKIQLWRVEQSGRPRGATPAPEIPPEPLSDPILIGQDPGVSGVSGVSPGPSPGTKQDPLGFPVEVRPYETPETPETPGTTLRADSPRSVTKAEAARRAAEDKITKTEARKRGAEENRRAATAAAAGEHIGLPAVVTREGQILAVTLEQAEAIVRTATARAGALTVDVETSGYPVGHVHHRLRTVQLGDEVAAVVLDPVEHADAIRTLLAGAPKLHAHSAAADLVPLAHAGLIDAAGGWARMFDTVIPAKLADPQSTGSDPGLKQLAGAVLGQAATAPAADEARTALFKAGGWPIGKQKFATQLTTPPERNGWAQVPADRATMVRYAASDVLDTAALARRLPEVPPAVLERERLAEEMTARVAHRGLRIDADRLAELTAEHTRLQTEAAARVRAFGDIDNPGSGQQVAARLTALGATIPVSDKGNPSVAEHVLSILKRTAADQPAGQLAAAVLDYRHSTTVLGLFLAPYSALVEHGDGRARPTIYTLGTDTGRMCLPTDHQLVTPDGYVKPESIHEGMLTMDATGRWVQVLAVHRYDDAPLTTLTNRTGVELAATPEHRWLTSLDHAADYARRKGRPVPPAVLRTLDERPRLRVHLAPDCTPFDFDARTIPAETEAQRFAALVGMLVTDGRCADSEETEVGLRAYVYQTELKFHAEFRRVIPEDAVMYDRVTTTGQGHHEIRIRARWLRPRLDAVGLRTGVLLKESPDLYGWAAHLPLDELRAFFAAVWLADGSLGRKHLSCGSANLRAVLTLVAYRLGALAYTVNDGPSEWSTKDRLGLGFREPVVTTRKSKRGAGRSDVWCVTTETGTFTAVNPNGMVYLTGNSSVRPNAQQLPREGGVRSIYRADPGHVFISADFAGVELRGAAALSQDPAMMRLISDEDDFNVLITARARVDGVSDKEARARILAERGWANGGSLDGFHWVVARKTFGEDATKADRYVAKRACFGTFYGGGSKTLAQQAGVPVHEMEQTRGSLIAVAPGYFEWVEQLKRGVRQGHTQFLSYSGRVIHFPAGTPHKAPAYAISGSCRELLVDALVRWRDTCWGDATLLPVHDELVIQVPAEDADAATAELTRCMESELYGVKIVAEASSPSAFWQDSV